MHTMASHDIGTLMARMVEVFEFYDEPERRELRRRGESIDDYV